MSMEPNASTILRMAAVCQVTKLGKSTVYRKLAEGTFPPPVRLGARAVGWKTRDIVAWLEAPARAWNPREAR